MHDIWLHYARVLINFLNSQLFNVNNTFAILIQTFMDFFMYLQLSFSMSWWDLIGCFSSSSTTMPGPCVQGPPTNIITRAPVFGYVHWKDQVQRLVVNGALLYYILIPFQKNIDYPPTSNNPTAMDKATPVDLRGRLPWETGHGSRWSSDNKSVKAISHLCTGCRNL